MNEKRAKRPTRWGIRVVRADGRIGLLRHGARAGHGAVVLFRSRQDAEVNRDFLQQGLDDDETAHVFRVPASMRGEVA